MTHGVIWKQLVAFSIPMAIGLLFQQLYNTVDTIVVGRFVGKEALAAVGSTGSIINMMVGLCAGLATGAGVVISQAYGARDNEKLRSAVHTTILVTLILGIAATFGGRLLVAPMLRLMKTPYDVLPQATEYLNIYFAGIAGLFMYNMGAGILRAVGDSRRPLYFLCISALLNIGLDLLFVITFDLGIAGVAYATILSQAISALLVLVTLTREDAPYGIRWRKIGIQKDMLGRILALGLPTSFQQTLTSFSNVFVQSYINLFGSVCVAGWACYNKVDIFILIPVQSLGMATMTFVGQNYGANDLVRTKQGVRQAMLLGTSVTALFSILLFLFDRPILMLFTTEEAVVRYGEIFVNLNAGFYVMLGFNQVYASALRGVGNTRAPMLIMLGSFVAFRQIYLYCVRQVTDALLPVAFSFPLGWTLCAVLMYVCYRRSIIGRTVMQPVAEG